MPTRAEGDPDRTVPAPASGTELDVAPRYATMPQSGGPGRIPDIVLPGYALHAEIGRGGQGVIYAARETTHDRDVAIKTIRPLYAADPDIRRRFQTEVGITARLPHPGVPPVYTSGTLPDGRPYLVMKLIKGRTLGELLAERPNPSHDLPRFVQIFEQVCQTVGFAHRAGIIHRDLKPANVMIGAFGEVQVMDWGVAKLLPRRPAPADAGPGAGEPAAAASGTREHPCGDTLAGAVIGTLSYMPPEQARGELDRIDERADVFALGGLLCAILTGKPPYAAETPSALMVQAHTGNRGEAMARLDYCAADKGLINIAKRCLRKCPDDRPADAAAVAGLLAEYRALAEKKLRDLEVELAAAGVRTAETHRRLAAEAEAGWEAEAKRKEREKRQYMQIGLFGALVAVAGLLVAGGWHIEKLKTERDEAKQRIKFLESQNTTPKSK